MLYISRLVVSLTHVQSIMAGKLSTQMLMSVGVALVLSLLFAVPALLCVQRDCSPLAHRTMGTLYACNFIFLAGINVSRFAYFASARLNPEAKSWGFALLIILFAVYGALVGLQGLSRFSGFAFCLIVLVVAVVLGFNVLHFQWFSLFPPGSNTVGEVVRNGVVLSANTAEITIFLVLADRVVIGGRRFGAFYGAMGCSYLTTSLLFLFAIAFMAVGGLVILFIVLAAGWEPVGFLRLFFVGIGQGIMMWAGALPCILLVVLLNRSYIISVIITFFYTAVNYIFSMSEIFTTQPFGLNLGTLLPGPLTFRWYFQYLDFSGPSAEMAALLERISPYFLNTAQAFLVTGVEAAVFLALIALVYKRQGV